MEKSLLHPDKPDQTTPDRPESDRVGSGMQETAEAANSTASLSSFTIEDQGETLVLHLNTPKPSKVDLEAFLETMETSHTQKIIADLSRTEFFDTTMLEALAAIWKRIRARGGKFSLRGVSATGLEILHIMRFDILWEIEEPAKVVPK